MNDSPENQDQLPDGTYDLTKEIKAGLKLRGLTPTRDKVLIEPLDAHKENDVTQSPVRLGRIVAVGTGRPREYIPTSGSNALMGFAEIKENHGYMPLDLESGMTVFFERHAGIPIRLSNERLYYLMPARCVLAVFSDEGLDKEANDADS